MPPKPGCPRVCPPWAHKRYATALSYHDYSVSGSSRQQCSGIPLKLLCLFSSILFHHKNFFVKYLISIDLLWLSETRYKPKLSHGLICHFMLDRLHWCAKQKNRTSVLLVPGRVVIYIKVHLVLIYTLTFSYVLLVLALNFMVHKSSYCKCSLAWCQVRTFLLFTIWTHPLQMREYPLRYAGTDRIKKSHYIVMFCFE